MALESDGALAHVVGPLTQEFYISDAIYRKDIDSIFRKSWNLVGHLSQLSEAGAYFLAEVAGESIIVLRDKDGLRAFYNVCRHRGSRICLEKAGTVSSFTCPYHAWTYRTDGSLRSAPFMSANFDKSAYGLRSCAVHEFEGLIFINLADDPGDFEAHYGTFRRFLSFQQLGRAQLVDTMDFMNAANWKLVSENFWECYHCIPAHPELMRVHSREQIAPDDGGANAASRAANGNYQGLLESWETKAANLGHVVGTVTREGFGLFDFAAAARVPLKDGCYSETQDGAQVGPLMGLSAWDGGMTMIRFNPFSAVLVSNDHAVLFSFIPRAARETMVRVWWLVDGTARRGLSFDPEKVKWLWRVTTEQDRTITENNQAGIMSRSYSPGVYSESEQDVVTFIKWYIAQITGSEPRAVADTGPS